MTEFERVEWNDELEDSMEWDSRDYTYMCDEYWDDYDDSSDDYSDESDEPDLGDGFAIWDEDPNLDDEIDWDELQGFSGASSCMYDEDTEDGAWIYEAMDQAWDEYDSGMSIIE